MDTFTEIAEMNRWFDDFPGRSRDYELRVAVEVQAELADDLEGEELRVARHLLGEWATAPGGLTAKLRQVEGMPRPEKREEVASAYHTLGLETPAEKVEREEYEENSRQVSHRPLPECAICGDIPRDSLGYPDPNVTPARRWHCPDHVHLAEPGDMGLPEPTFRLVGGASVLDDSDEIERERRRDQQIQREQEERDEQRRLRGRELAEVRKVRQRQFDEELRGGPR